MLVRLLDGSRDVGKEGAPTRLWEATAWSWVWLRFWVVFREKTVLGFLVVPWNLAPWESFKIRTIHILKVSCLKGVYLTGFKGSIGVRVAQVEERSKR